MPERPLTAGAPQQAPIVGEQTGWWLEDAVPGAVIRHPHGRTIDDAEHVWLAWVTHNLSDVHGDAHASASGPFGGPLVLGVLTVAIVIGLAEPAVPAPRLAWATRGAAWQSVRLRRPVRAGDTLVALSRIESVDPGPTPDTGFVTRTIEGRDQEGRVVAIIEETNRLVTLRSAIDC